MQNQQLEKAETALKKAGIIASTPDEHLTWFHEGKNGPLPSGQEALAIHVLLLCCYGCKDSRGLKEWLNGREFEESDNMSWDQLVLHVVFCTWVDIFEGFRGFARENIDQLRSNQVEGERGLFEGMESGKRQMARKLVFLYCLAAASECIDAGDAVGFDRYIRLASSSAVSVEWGNLVNWLHVAGRVLLEEVLS